MRVRRRLQVCGVVQGVGFRPFVHALAASLGLAGFVRNDGNGVTIEVEGAAGDVEHFVDELTARPPPLAVLEAVTTMVVPPNGASTFAIVESEAALARRTLVSPDVATCADCLAELRDPADRRYRYPFTNCTNCGPRFTIVLDVPYDRANTTMAGFSMCARCGAEYADPSDRRFHAQPVACPECGPTLSLPLSAAAAHLLDGRIVAVKGLGGYQLACDATSEAAVTRLRERKGREEKAFAVMVADLTQARRLCDLSRGEEVLLSSPRAPIVLAPRRPDAPVANAVAPGNRSLGVFLPTTPLHHLLLEEVGRPLVMTSGNRSDEPIAYRDDEAAERLAPIADLILAHDRPIHTRCDDSVVRVVSGRPLPVRRARGYAPEPVRLPYRFVRPVLAVGAELKHTFCLGRDDHAFVSQHIGDLENYETMQSFLEGVAHYGRLFDVSPDVVAADLHPEYLSTKWAIGHAGQHGLDLVGVQHHHAHVASCLADNGRVGPVIGLALDGVGFGPDGTLWGGEVLVCDLRSYRRVGHLARVPMPGGVAAIREPWRMAAAYLLEAFGTEAVGAALSPVAGLAARHCGTWERVVSVARLPAYSPLSSGAGRLFDAVSALLGVRDHVSYAGQAAIELEQQADPSITAGYACPLVEQPDGSLLLDTLALFREVATAAGDGRPLGEVAARFHWGLSGGLVLAARAARDQTGISTVALSGGTFQNLLLVERTMQLLESAGFEVLTHRQVPPNDGGISLGQAVVAASATLDVGPPLEPGH